MQTDAGSFAPDLLSSISAPPPRPARWLTLAAMLVLSVGLAACGSEDRRNLEPTDQRDAGTVDVEPADTGPQCDDDQTVCEGTCVTTANDPDHCGACGETCATGQKCADGECVLACPDGQQACDGGCFDVDSSRQHCGACGNACETGEVCQEGSCETSCAGSLTACDGSCRDLDNDPANCGACGNTCESSEVCVDGGCTIECPDGQTTCNGRCFDLDLANDHCGACGNTCQSGQVCSDGSCEPTCGDGLTECDGACRDTSADPEHCGTCGNTCGDDEACVEGKCTLTCPGDQQVCNGNCYDLQTSSRHCGSCDNACGAGETCEGGSCVVSCLDGQTECNGSCYDLQNARQHCGSCGNACGDGEVCSGGDCVVSCADNQTECDGACYDLQNSRQHCGSCGNACGAGEICSGGSCVVSCPDNRTECDGACYDLQTSANHCGSCGNSCGIDSDCIEGQCTTLSEYPSAVSGQTLWLEADGSVSTTSSGDAVTGWTDESGAGNDASAPSDDSKKPTLTTDPWGGHDALYFDGDDHLTLPDGFDDWSDGLTMFVVARPTDEDADSRILEFGSGSQQDNIMLGRDGGSDNLFYDVQNGSNSGSKLVGSDGLPGRNYVVGTVTQQPNGDVTIASSNSQIGSSSASLPTTVTRTDNYIAGTDFSGTPNFEGYIAEIILYDRALSGKDRTNITHYLADKYQLYHSNADWIDSLSSDDETLVRNNDFHEYQLDEDVYSSLPPGDSCQDLLSKGHDRDGLYRIQPASLSNPMLVSCDMTSDGGGWVELSLDNPDRAVVGEYSSSNPWHKCADDAAKHFSTISGDTSATPESSPNDHHTYETELNYLNPFLDEQYTDPEMTALRSLASELHSDTRMVTLTADDDNNDYHNTNNSGHEVYILDDSNNWQWMTPGEDGECGGSSGWPAGGSETGFYLWHSTDAESVVDGQTGRADDSTLDGLSPDALIPHKVRLEVRTGGGAAMGWEKEVFKVR